MTSHLFTVVMATMNSDRYIEGSLRSIERQSVGIVRTIVVDNASSDRTREIAESFRFVEFVAQQSDGYQMAWNEGLQMATSPFVALLDSDDSYTPTALESGYALLTAHDDADAALGKTEFALDDVQPLRNARERLFESFVNAPIPGAFVFRRSLFEKVGYFGTEYQILSDVEWVLRLKARDIKICNHDNVVLRKRVHSQSLGARAAASKQYQQEFLRLVRRHARSGAPGFRTAGA